MAKLYQSEWDEIRTRRGVQDFNNLIALIEEDGSIEIADDPSESEIKAARKKAEKDAEAQQKENEREAEKQAKEEEKARKEEIESAQTARVADKPLPEDTEMDDITANPPEGSEVAQGTDKTKDEPKAGSKK